MARVNLFEFTSVISKESVSAADDKDVKVETIKDLPEQLKEDAPAVEPEVHVAPNDAKTSEPGPAEGGGDGTAVFEQAKEAEVELEVSDVNENLNRDQNGGREMDTVTDEVKANDGLSASDISTSVEEHTGEVSELETIDAGGAEEVGEADCLVMDLDDEPLEITGLTEVTEDGLDKAAELAEKAAEVETAVASVERYIGLLGRIEAEGKVLSPELRQAISWGLESIDAELFKSECVSLEALEGTIDDGDEPGVVKKGLSGKLKKLIEAGVKLFWRLVNAVGDIYQSLIADSTKIRQHLSDLRSKVKTLEGGQKFTMKNPHRLLVGEEFVGDSKAAIDTVSKVTGELLGTWPERLRKIVEKYSNMNKGKFAGLVDELNDAMKGSFRGFKSLSSQDRDHVPSGFLGADELRWSGILPGNRGVYTSINKSDKGLAESNVSDKITISFSAVPNEATNSGEVEVSTLTAGEATTIIRELEKLLNTLDETKREAAEFKKKSSDYIRSAVHDLLGMTGNGAEDQIAGVVLLNTINKTNETHRQYIGYVIGLVKAYMGYIHASLKAEHGDVIEG